MFAFCFKYIRISIFKTDIGDDLYLDVTQMTDEETTPRSKKSYVNLSEYKNSTVPPAPKPSGISMILKPILSLKGVQFQENVDQATSGKINMSHTLFSFIYEIYL